MSTIRLGDRVDNGATVIDIKKAWDTSGYIVLCLRTDSQADPYVTWFARVEEGKTICSTGHYFDQLKDAVVDFSSRI